MVKKRNFLKRIIIVVLGVLIFIIFSLICYFKFISIPRRYEDLSQWGMEYLESKYSEEMVIKDGYSVYDSVSTMWVYPKHNEEINFVLRYIDVEGKPPYFVDDYLLEYLEWSASVIIQENIEEYYNQAEYIIILTEFSPGQELKKNLENYYSINGRPLDWDSEDSLKSIYKIIIKNYDGKIEKIDSGECLLIMDDVKKCPFSIEEIIFELYEDNRAKEPKDRVEYVLEDGEYKLNL